MVIYVKGKKSMFNARSQSSRIICHGTFLYFTFYIVIFDVCGNSILKVIRSFSFLGYILLPCIPFHLLSELLSLNFNQLFHVLTVSYSFLQVEDTDKIKIRNNELSKFLSRISSRLIGKPPMAREVWTRG